MLPLTRPRPAPGLSPFAHTMSLEVIERTRRHPRVMRNVRSRNLASRASMASGVSVVGRTSIESPFS